MNNLERNTNYIYELYSETLGLLVIQEPKGYENDTRGYTRDADTKGFIIKTEIDLEFFGDGADYLYTIFRTKGIQETVLISKKERNLYSITEEFKQRYIQEIDLGSLKRDEDTGAVTVQATQGGLYDDIKNRENDEYDLLDNLSADGIDIGELKVNPFTPVPRSLFLESLFKDEQFGYTLFSNRGFKKSDIRETRTIPLKKEYLSGDNVQVPYLSDVSNNGQNTSESIYIGDVEQVGNIFFWRSDIQKRTLRLKLNLRYKIRENSGFRNVSNVQFSLAFKISKQSEDGLDDIIDRFIHLHQFDPTENINVEQIIDNERYDIDLQEGESLSLCFNVYGYNILKTQPITFNTASIQLFFDIPVCQLSIEDDADYPPTESRCVKAIDFLDRIVAKITGKNGLVESELFTTGKYKDLVLDNGFFARGFPNFWQNPDEEEQKIQFKSSFKDAFESLEYLEPLTWFTFFEGNTEKIKIEDAKYTQQNFIALDLGEVDNIKSEVSKIDFFSNIEIGHTRPMEYEELSGLDEPNGKSEFTTFITKTNSKYTALSKIRTDATSYELARRKPYDKYPKEDTSYDDNLFMHDAKLMPSGKYTHKLWNDVDGLDEVPKGVFKPVNFWNFNLSPMNRLFYGHSYSIKRGLYHFPNKLIRFNSSNSNNSLITKKNGKELIESGSLQVKELETPRVEAEKVSFTFKMSQLIEDVLLSSTKVNNIDVPNYFGLIKYKEQGVDKYGRLIKLETNEEAKIELIKARI